MVGVISDVKDCPAAAEPISSDNRRTVYETTWTDYEQVVEVQFGPGHDCGRLTGKPEVGFPETTADAAVFTDPVQWTYSRVTGQ